MEGGGAGRGAGMVPAHRVAAPRHPDTQRNHLEVSLSLSNRVFLQGRMGMANLISTIPLLFFGVL